MTQSNQGELNELALFAGAGGGILGGGLLGWRTVCAVEWEPYPACVLAARQNDKILPPFPIWDDVQTFDGKPWRGIVDVVSGGFPCQDISSAGRGAGIEGSRSGMWKHMARIIGEVRPRFAFVENSPMLVGRGAAMVIGDLTEMGYDCEWCIISASDCGAPHKRDRFWLVGLRNRVDAEADTQRSNTNSFRSHRASVIKQGGFELRDQQNSFLKSVGESLADTNLQHGEWGPESLESISTSGKAWAELGRCNNNVAHANSPQCEGSSISSGIPPQNANISGYGGNAEVSNTTSQRQQRQGQSWFSCDPAEKREGETDQSWAERVGHIWGIEPNVGRVANGVAARVDRLKAIGNGQVPRVAATAFKLLAGKF